MNLMSFKKLENKPSFQCLKWKKVDDFNLENKKIIISRDAQS